MTERIMTKEVLNVFNNKEGGLNFEDIRRQIENIQNNNATFVLAQTSTKQSIFKGLLLILF